MKDVIIIGCGVIGASCAYELSKHKVSLTVLEADNDVANGTTKANSAIIHAGYDPVPGSEMAKLNVLGNKLAGEICEKLDVPFKRVGSLVVAKTEEQAEEVKNLYERGLANGVPGVRIMDSKEVHELEPNLSPDVISALFAPSAGIISPWEYCLAMAETAVRNGAELCLNSKVTGIEKRDGIFHVFCGDKEYMAKYVINCAGVKSGEVHEMIAPKDFTIITKKGEYFLLDKSEGKRVSHVVFPCPDKNGKGVLVSPTVHGNLIVGPNSAPSEADDVTTTTEGMNFVRTNATANVPGINFRDNIRNFAGVRAASNESDFIIREASVSGFIDVAGICSPGLSAAPAIAIKVAGILGELGLELNKKENFIDERKRIRFNELSDYEKAELVKKEPAYGRVICRCETITEGEIIAALHSPIPPVSVNGVKRRAGAGMGRCQGGFCGPRVQEIIARELNLDPCDVMMDQAGTYVLTGETKEGK